MNCFALGRTIRSHLSLFLIALWILPRHADVQGNPQIVSLSASQNSVAPGDLVALSIDVQQGTQNNLVDGWGWLVLLDGSRAFLQPDLATFSSVPTPTVQGFTAVDFFGPIFQSVVPSFLPSGTYTFFAVGVVQGFDPFTAIYRVTNMSSVSVVVTEFPPINLSGTWQESWVSVGGVGGDLLVEVVHTDASLDGSIGISGSPCFAGGEISGNVNGNTVVFGAVLESQQQSDFTGTINAAGTAAQGSYATKTGPCAGDVGTWDVTKLL